jgi:hypothetical protein
MTPPMNPEARAASARARQRPKMERRRFAEARKAAARNKLVIPQSELRMIKLKNVFAGKANILSPEARIAQDITINRAGRNAVFGVGVLGAGAQGLIASMAPEIRALAVPSAFIVGSAGIGATAKVSQGVKASHHNLEVFLKSPEGRALRKKAGKNHAFLMKTARGFVATNALPRMGYGRVELNPALVDQLGHRARYDKIAADRARAAQTFEKKAAKMREKTERGQRKGMEAYLTKQPGGLWNPKAGKR